MDTEVSIEISDEEFSSTEEVEQVGFFVFE